MVTEFQLGITDSDLDENFTFEKTLLIDIIPESTVISFGGYEARATTYYDIDDQTYHILLRIKLNSFHREVLVNHLIEKGWVCVCPPKMN